MSLIISPLKCISTTLPGARSCTVGILPVFVSSLAPLKS